MEPNIGEKAEGKTYTTQEPTESPEVVPLDQIPKGRWERSWPVIACGAGLFSDGYLNGVRSPILPSVSAIYVARYCSLDDS